MRKILDRLQAAGWAYCVTLKDTRAEGNRRLTWIEDAVKGLNKRQKRIRLSGDGSGVCYQIVESGIQSEAPP